jgi:hypothetical protein
MVFALGQHETQRWYRGGDRPAFELALHAERFRTSASFYAG